MKHWRMDQIDWDSFDATKVDPEVVPIIKAAAMVERNALEYAAYLNSVFRDDPAFREAADHWAVEEVQHGDALGRWACLADPAWDYAAAFARYKDGYKIETTRETSLRGSLSGELVARCMVETGTSSYYSALGDATEEPVLKQICRLIAADEFRHFKLFYDHMKRFLDRERISRFQRFRVALGRITDSEDDELAYAFHCGNEPPELGFDHDRCIAGYMGRAMAYYRFKHWERAMGMIFKAIGLEPRGRLSGLAAKSSWHLLQRKRQRYAEINRYGVLPAIAAKAA